MNLIKLYNTLSRQKEEFKPIKKGEVSMYSCGPTVYDTPHIGNYRTFVMNDIVRRAFEYVGYGMNQVMNITDVDDKTIKKSHEEKVKLKIVTTKYEKMFLEGLQSLNIILPEHLLRASENIEEMIELVDVLLKKGVAYTASDGIYLSIAKVKNYGELTGSHFAETSGKERIANDEYDKENPGDFVLWKFKTTEDGEVSWKSRFGEGRPGWHIECSAMAMKILGSTIDIHTGGSDLIFPHHTNEIAQSESATGVRFVNYWLHGGFMNIKEEKMSKSKHNIIRLDDLLDKSISPLSYRYWLLTAHYRSLVNFSYEAVEAAQNALIRFIATVASFPEGGKIINSYQEQFETFISDDFDTPKAIALAWELLKDANHVPADKRATILDFDRVFGLEIAKVKKVEEQHIPEEVVVLAEAREQARLNKDWKKADALRVEIEGRGFEINDTDQGFKLKSKNA